MLNQTLQLIKIWVCTYLFHHPTLRITRVDKTEMHFKDMTFFCECWTCGKTFITDYYGFQKLSKQRQLKH